MRCRKTEEAAKRGEERCATKENKERGKKRQRKERKKERKASKERSMRWAKSGWGEACRARIAVPFGSTLVRSGEVDVERQGIGRGQ